MTIPAATKNNMLNGQAFTHASVHTGFPGVLGSNEVSGGTPAYAREAVTINAASGGIRNLNAAVTFDVPAATIKWIGMWDGATFVCCAPNGGATPKNFVATPSSDSIQCPGHGYVDAQPVVFYNGTPPAGLVEGTTYYVRDAAADTFKVAATAGGVAIDLTAASSFGCVVCAITETIYAVQSTHQLDSSSFVIPD